MPQSDFKLQFNSAVMEYSKVELKFNTNYIEASPAVLKPSESTEEAHGLTTIQVL